MIYMSSCWQGVAVCEPFKRIFHVSIEPGTGKRRWHHLDESIFNKVLKKVASDAGIKMKYRHP